MNETITPVYNGTDEVQPYIDEVERQGGLIYVAHAWRTWDKWMDAYECGITLTGWEVKIEEDIYEWTMDNELGYLLNHDFHDDSHIRYLETQWSILIAEDSSEEAIKDALVYGRVVIYCYGQMYGSYEMLSLYYSVLAS